MSAYIGVGGMGVAFVNARLLTLVVCTISATVRAPMTGASIACLSLVLGFGLFGKTLLNVWGIAAGVYLFARYRAEPFAAHINTAFFGGALAPCSRKSCSPPPCHSRSRPRWRWG